LHRENSPAWWSAVGPRSRQYLPAVGVGQEAQASRMKADETLTEQDIPRLKEILITAFTDFHRQNPKFRRLLTWENLNNGET
jgi:hypothetical protein